MGSNDRGRECGSLKKREMGGQMKELGEMRDWGVLNGLILKKTPAGSGRVRLINHAMIPRRRSVAVVTTRRWFHRMCPSLKIIDRHTWYDGGIRRSVADATVRRCICQRLLQSNFLKNFLEMCLQIKKPISKKCCQY